MSTIPIQAEIEDRFCRLLDEHGLPMPDRSLWGARSVSFCWESSRTVVIVDADELDSMVEIPEQLARDLNPTVGGPLL